jgi:hypothetical protein
MEQFVLGIFQEHLSKVSCCSFGLVPSYALQQTFPTYGALLGRACVDHTTCVYVRCALWFAVGFVRAN